jgi:hypothetical protein
VLPIFEQANPADRRPREALDGALDFSRGALRVGAARELALACHAAAREADTPAATAAARACGQAVSVAHMASHVRGVTLYALKAVALAHPGDADAAAAEEAWHRAHVPERFRTFVYPEGREQG